MTDATDAPAQSAGSATGRVSFERLRERTDELELINSGLSLFALMSLPGWLWSGYEEYFPRMSLMMAAGSTVLLPMVTAICYVGAALFLLHLAVRAHWVGLIGLKAVFPEGVRWERLGGMGRITRERLQKTTPSLEHSIERADVIASTLFSLITFSAMALLVLAIWLGFLFVLAGLFGEHLGGVNAFLNVATSVLLLAYLGVPLSRWVLDGLLIRRFPRLAEWSWIRGPVSLLGWLEQLFLPARIMGASRLVLQSNLLPRLFLALFIGTVLLVSGFSSQVFQNARSLDVLSTQTYATGRQVAGGMRSGNYESLRVSRDSLRPMPMIPAPIVETAWLPVFLPYMPLSDDPVLRQRCPRVEAPPASFQFGADDTDAEAVAREKAIDGASATAAACLRRVWEVTLDGVPQSLEGFVVSERADLGMRGLSGWLPLEGLQPGPHRLEVIWRPKPEQDTLAEDYVPRRVRYVIPFLWSPERVESQPGAIP